MTPLDMALRDDLGIAWQGMTQAEYAAARHATIIARGRLEALRGALRAEDISYGELAELQSLAAYIEPGDVELLEPAGVAEFAEPCVAVTLADRGRSCQTHGGLFPESTFRCPASIEIGDPS